MVCHDRTNDEAAGLVEVSDFLEQISDGFDLSIGQGLDGCELELSRFSDKESNLVNEHDVDGEGHLGM